MYVPTNCLYNDNICAKLRIGEQSIYVAINIVSSKGKKDQNRTDN